MKHLLKMADLSAKEIIEILNMADQLKYETRHGIAHPCTAGQDAGHDFSKGVDPHPRFV